MLAEAVKSGDIRLCRELIEEHPELVHEDDGYLLNLSTRYKFIEITQLLLDTHAVVDGTSFFTIVGNGWTQMVHALQENGFDVAASHYFEEINGLHMAASSGSVDMCRFFLDDVHLDVNSRCFFNDTPMFYAANVDVCEFLIERGADVHARNNFGETPLFRCTDVGRAECLIRHGIDKEAKDQYGYTALHDSVRRYEKDVCRFLVQSGLDIHARSHDGLTPLDVSISMNADQIQAFLESVVGNLA